VPSIPAARCQRGNHIADIQFLFLWRLLLGRLLLLWLVTFRYLGGRLAPGMRFLHALAMGIAGGVDPSHKLILMLQFASVADRAPVPAGIAKACCGLRRHAAMGRRMKAGQAPPRPA
jgi:hypothetical protein